MAVGERFNVLGSGNVPNPRYREIWEISEVGMIVKISNAFSR